jgi:hypothetical protein
LQTLYFAAMLRLPKDWPREKKLDRVEMVLQGLGLMKCRDTIIVSTLPFFMFAIIKDDKQNSHVDGTL